MGLNLTAQISLNTFGINAFNLSVYLCSVLSGVLCPLPRYKFTRSGKYAITPANIPSIPALAWTVPDIEALFTVRLLNASTQSSAACFQVTLTNTLTVREPAVVWSSGSSVYSFLQTSGFSSESGRSSQGDLAVVMVLVEAMA
ncbi:ML-like domain-domain-containing protein [Phakopsora pachyrhizi]|uniref:ML-like domain-domain-containing protein n=1 Tax=Phakopsora pachyrhizi TaxID=170000 RepID=A0AAV0B056_PHAPC|nr:ML-like domain-domain-containing protein [Phakopsora pachyrhizi]